MFSTCMYIWSCNIYTVYLIPYLSYRFIYRIYRIYRIYLYLLTNLLPNTCVKSLYIYIYYIYTLLLHYITVHHIASHHMIITCVLIFILLYFSFKFTVACALPCISSHYITWHGTNRHDWHGKTCIVFQYVNTRIYIYIHTLISHLWCRINYAYIAFETNIYIYTEREGERTCGYTYVSL